VAAQDSTASPAAGPAIEFTPGIVPTIFGDVTLPENPTKIVTLTDGSLDAMITAGVIPVGATTSANFEGAAAYIADRVPDSVEWVGGWGELDIEKVVALAPDLILSDRYLTAEDYAVLSQIAPVVAPREIEVAGPDALQQWEYEQLVWGHAVGKLAEAEQALADLHAYAAGLQSVLGDHVGESVAVFRPQTEGPVIMSHNWITGVVLTWAGVRGTEYTESLPPPHGGLGSLEELKNMVDADWIFLAARNQEMVDAVASVYETLPVYQALKAVQSGQVSVVSGDLWSGATGVQAAYAMLADLQRILLGDAAATPTAS
jgi:iron complex transport system substrate-binding protein